MMQCLVLHNLQLKYDTVYITFFLIRVFPFLRESHQPTVCVAEFCREHNERAAGLVRLRQGGAERLRQPGDRGDATAHLCSQRYCMPS